jgi:hypothetical protein
VIAGAKMTKYLAPTLSAIYPINGFNTDGILENVVNTPADVNDIERFSIKPGRSGAKNDVYRS